MNNPNFKKNDDIRRQNRIVYIILAASLAILAILISISVISSRNGGESVPPSTRETEMPTESTKSTEKATESVAAETETSSETEVTTEQATEDVGAAAEAEDVLPDFVPVCAGVLMKEYSDSVPVYSITMNDYRTHSGVDIAAPVGSDVYAAATGTIGAVWEDPMNGCSLTLIHKGGAVSTYSNLSRETIEVLKPGMSILGGDVLGTVGDTSLVEIADEAHVHYELSIDGKTVNPAEYIEFSQAENYAE